jgi:FkbM family methyltransferase
LVWTRRHLAGQLAVPELAPLLPLLRANDVFLDVGAHAGGWAVPVSRTLTAGHVYAFEALPYYAGVLKSTLTLLGRRNVTVVVGAVSDAEGELSIVWKDSAGQRLTGRTHISRGSEAGEVVRVKALTIDRFCASQGIARVRLMKHDVEGAELMVLRGAIQTIERWRPFIYCELYEEYCAQYGHTARDVFAFFAERRYRAVQIEDGAFHPLMPETYSGVGDVLFVPMETELAT